MDFFLSEQSLRLLSAFVCGYMGKMNVTTGATANHVTLYIVIAARLTLITLCVSNSVCFGASVVHFLGFFPLAQGALAF